MVCMNAVSGRRAGFAIGFGAPHALRWSYEFFGAEHMLFASDMPFGPVQGSFIRDTIADVEALAISDAERKRIYEATRATCCAFPSG
jgi:hypothetical protein